MKYDDLPRAGILKSPWENVRPNWLPYIRVEDPAMVTDRVPKIGGKVILEPDPGIRKGSVAVIADPTGAVLAVQKWPM
jgi:predicted enzyme related to lactoylglutathione lyase